MPVAVGAIVAPVDSSVAVAGTAGVATGLTTAPLAVLPPARTDAGADTGEDALDADVAVAVGPDDAPAADSDADIAALADGLGACVAAEATTDEAVGCRNSAST